MQASIDDFIKPAYLSIEKLPGSAGKLKTLLKGKFCASVSSQKLHGMYAQWWLAKYYS